MSWAARLAPSATGLTLHFSEPVKRLDLTFDVARQLAALLAMAAERRQPPKPRKGSPARGAASR